jgi:hypothetical protein
MGDSGTPHFDKDAVAAELTSWKEIASYLRVSPKTAQRYETDRGMPVRRLGNRVAITIAEVERWKATQSPSVPWHKDVRYLRPLAATLAIALAGCVAAAGGYIYSQLPGRPVSITAEGKILRAIDREGRAVWNHTFGDELGQFPQPDDVKFRLVDIDGDGRLEAVGVWNHNRRDMDGWKVTCLSPRGEVRWQIAMEDHVQTANGRDFGPPYVVRDLEVFESPEGDATKWTAIVFAHVADVVSTIVVVDQQGKRRGQYWHVGHLNSLEFFDADADGKLDLVAGGVRHGVDQAVLVVFDPARVAGTNAMPPGHARAIVEKAPSSEKQTAFFARSELSKRTALFNYVTSLLSVNGLLQAHLSEQLQAPAGYLLYNLAPGLRVKSISMSVSFASAHKSEATRELFDEGFPTRDVIRLQKEFRVESGR